MMGFTVIRKLISEAAVSPLQFLKGISGVSTTDQRDYVDSFLKSTISNSISEAHFCGLTRFVTAYQIHQIRKKVKRRVLESLVLLISKMS